MRDENAQVGRTIGILLSAAVLVGAYATCGRGSGIAEALHLAVPLAFLVFTKLVLDEGRARERAAHERSDRTGPTR